MTAAADVAGFIRRFQDLRTQQDSSDALINDLLVYCERTETQLRQEKQQLSDELRDCRLDLADATNSRRDLQQRLQTYETSYGWLRKENDDLKNRNPYVLLLIDGDGLMFQEHWIKQGIEGGKSAAYALRSAVAEQCGARADDIEVVARIVANLGGLTRAMQRDGCVDSSSNLKDFTLGFTQAKASFDFIDVGKGKERADSKIKESTRWHLQNQNCKQVLLGISHDSGYAPFLDEILLDETTRKRVTVLEGTPTVQELAATKVNILNLARDLFRSEKLIDRALVTNVSRAPPPPPPTTAPVYASPSTSSSSVATPPTTSVSYANVISSASPPPQVTIPLSIKPTNTKMRQKTISPMQRLSWNPGPRGLDDIIPMNISAMEAIKKRKDTNKLCNNHYLRGPCTKETCSFVHDYKPSADEVHAIAVLARLNPCTSGQECTVEDCIYGHHCPSVRDGFCVHPYCKFPQTAHPPGTKYKNMYIRNN